VFHEREAMTAIESVSRPAPQEGYYGLPMLKRPLWGWEIALYFLFEGISSGCFILASLADLTGEDRHPDLIRHARYLALATLLPCPPLLIADLGRPERFHHMLRIVNRRSPMSLGAWSLTAYSGPVALLALRQFVTLRWIPPRAVSLAGLPFAFFMLIYPGVLLSTTSIPLWSRTSLLGPLLGSSSMAAAASTLAIASAVDPNSTPETRLAIERVERIAQTAEAVALAGYVYTAGPAAAPLRTGRYSRLFRYGALAGGILLPAVITTLRRKKPARASTAIAGILSLAGSLCLKWAIVHAGRESADAPARADTP
jgi:formate-dependent nitrite reductase membrane component NrfD